MSPRSDRLLHASFLGLGLWLVAAAAQAGSSIVLYSNDFETPNVPIEINCGNSLDTRTIDELYGDPSFVFHQQFTVEAISIDDAGDLYSDPEGVGGSHAIGMLSGA
jgi:hypothetical protein